MIDVHNLTSTYVDVGPGKRGAAVPGGPAFWQALMTGQANLQGDWLMTASTSDGDWPHWEMHPHGEEVVLLVSGSMDFELEVDGERTTVQLRNPCDYVLVPRGAWHIARNAQAAQLVVLTAGEGTQHRADG